MKVTVDLDRCIMAGECVYNHPWLFEFDESGYSRVKVAQLTTDQERKEARQAQAVCPGGAITVHED